MTKVLVVEDDDINMKLMLEILGAQGFMIEGAKNGIDAIRMTEKGHYDLILMDIELPGMDGIDTAREIKGKPQFKDVPIVALTAYAMKGDKERILEAGLDAYISKPIHVADFMATMEKYRK